MSEVVVNQKKSFVKGLPIYKSGNELVKLAISSSKGFTREMRPLLGRMMLEESVTLVGHIIRANSAWGASEKIAHLDLVLRSVDVMELLWQSAYEFRLVNKIAWGDSIRLTGDIGSQAGGWRKSLSAKAAGR